MGQHHVALSCGACHRSTCSSGGLAPYDYAIGLVFTVWLKHYLHMKEVLTGSCHSCTPAECKNTQVHAPSCLQLCQLSVRIFNATVREVLLAVGGYEAKEVGGLALVAFDSPKVALEWALALQLALLMVRAQCRSIT